MRLPALRILTWVTWVTVVAAVVSALWLALVAGDPGVALRLTAAPAVSAPAPWAGLPLNLI